MAHIKLPGGAPGILGPLMAYPDSEKHLSGLAQAVLRGPSSLTEGEREAIATFVSSGNECYFCTNSHAAAARHLLEDKCGMIDDIVANAYRQAGVSEKLADRCSPSPGRSAAMDGSSAGKTLPNRLEPREPTIKRFTTPS